jgi:hypothetical protein
MRVVVEGATYLGLIVLSDRRDAVVGEDRAEIRAALDVCEVDPSVVCHMRYYPESYSQQ